MSLPKILFVDDSIDLQVLVKQTLNEYEVFSAHNIEEAKKLFESRKFDVVIIDLMLDQENGMDLLDEFKSNPGINNQTRFFIMTSKTSVSDEAHGHNAGVDEYIKKPVDREVLKAIVRKNINIIKKSSPQVLDVPPFYLEPQNHEAYLVRGAEKEPLNLTAKEMKLLALLISHPDKTYSREELFQLVWDNDSDSTHRTIDMHISSLRKKIKEYAPLIKTVHQIGYKFLKP